jgi:hypothetical protein
VGGGAPRGGQHALQRECDHLLSSLRRDRTNVQYFLAPVDPVALNAPNYLEVIKRPMDLGTVARKLRDVSVRHAPLLPLLHAAAAAAAVACRCLR